MSRAPAATVSSGRRVAVVGAGASGTSAAFAARRAGAHVTIVVGRPGATSLTSGAVDGDGHDVSVGQAVSDFVEALGIWELSASEACCVATVAGLLRPALGRDVGVLDLARVEPGVVGVVRAARAGWDADAVARAWTHEPYARARGLTFEPMDVESLYLADEGTIPIADLALRHDAKERADWLAGRLTSSPELRRTRAVLLGPWLGVRRTLARELSALLGKPVGEPLSAPGGAAGLRFESARDALLSRHGIARRDGQMSGIERIEDSAMARVVLTDGSHVDAHTVVLATGGLVGGGIGWASLSEQAWQEEVAASPATGFVGPPGVDVALAIGRSPVAMSGAPHGALFASFAWAGGSAQTGMERVGIWTADNGTARARDGKPIPWLYCAGDTVAGASRTVLQAVRSGLASGLAAVGASY